MGEGVASVVPEAASGSIFILSLVGLTAMGRLYYELFTGLSGWTLVITAIIQKDVL